MYNTKLVCYAHVLPCMYVIKGELKQRVRYIRNSKPHSDCTVWHALLIGE